MSRFELALGIMCFCLISTGAWAAERVGLPAGAQGADGNIIVNPGLESQEQFDWFGSSATVELVQTKPHSGAWCLRITDNSDSWGQGNNRRLKAPPGQYDVEAWVRVDPGFPTTPGPSARPVAVFDVQFFDSKGGYIGADTVGETSSTEWSRLSGVVTVRDNAASVALRIMPTGPSAGVPREAVGPLKGACFADDFSFIPIGRGREASTRFFKTHRNTIDLQEQGDRILFANRQIGLEFQRSAGGFQLDRLYGIVEEQDFLAAGGSASRRGIFEVSMTLDPKFVGKDERGVTKPGHLAQLVAEMEKDAFPVGSQGAKSVSWRREGTDAESVLHLEWKGIDVKENKNLVDVEVTVALRAGDPLSYWRIAVRNRSTRYGITRVRFPILGLAPIGKAEDNVLIYPSNRGCLVEDPFKWNGNGIQKYYPLDLNMQFEALYNRQSGNGLYVGTRDPAPNLMCVNIIGTRSETLWYPSHFPPNIAYSEEDYSVPYDMVAGPFRGDWYDACQIYRAWALKQSWCRKGPLATRKDVPKWYKEAPLFFYTHLSDSAEGTHSRADNLPIAAAHFREWLKWTGMRLPANWYGWKEYHSGLSTYDVPFCTRRPSRYGRWAGLPNHAYHDGQYPRIPALHDFSETCRSLRQEGGMVCPYTSLELFDQGPSENSPYAAEAKPYVLRDLYGAMRTWGYDWLSWQICSATQWWRDRLKETCVLMLERENVGGFYLDVMQGCSRPCYWTPHGHSAGGGSMTTKGQHELVEILHNAVKAKDPEAITTGENSAENMIDVIDGALELTLAPQNTAPLFAAVYQDYIKRYGLELSVGPGDAFFIQSASLFVEGAQIGRLRLRPRDMSLSFQKPEHKEMIDFLGRVVGYYKQETTKKFLAYGQLMRPLEFREPTPMPAMLYKSPYGGEGHFPALMSGVFRSDDGELGVFVVNAGSGELGFRSDLDPSRYGVPADAAVEVDSISPDGASRRVLSGAKGVILLEGSLPARHITMFWLKPRNR